MMSTSNPSTSSATEAAKQQIRQWFTLYVKQFTQGCGVNNCSTANCASNSGFEKRNSQQAAAEAMPAIKAYKAQGICVHLRSQLNNTAAPPLNHSTTSNNDNNTESTSGSNNSSSNNINNPTITQLNGSTAASTGTATSPSTRVQSIASTITPIPASVAESNAFPENFLSSGSTLPTSSSPLVKSITPNAIPLPSIAISSNSVADPESPPIQYQTFQAMIDQAKQSNPPNYTPLIRLLGRVFGDQFAVENSWLSFDKENKAIEPTVEDPAINWEEVDKIYNYLTENDNALVTPFQNGWRRLLTQLAFRPQPELPVKLLRALVILLENPAWYDMEFYDTYRVVCKLLAGLNKKSKAILVDWYSKFSTIQRLEGLLNNLQQYVSVRWMFAEKNPSEIQYHVVVIGILNSANEKIAETKVPTTVIPYQQFYNDAVNESYNDQKEGRDISRYDYRCWVTKTGFSFADYSFLLDPASKSRLLQIDASVQMYREMEARQLELMFNRAAGYLIIKVHRNNLIQETLLQLQNRLASDFKKPLKVHFIGESGIDEGGLQKEFFQLLIFQLFDAKYGMFIYDEETHNFKFNHISLDSPLEFELIGILLGLAIYNGVILDIRFPLVYYKKLMGVKPSFRDFEESYPTLAKGFKQLLAFDGDVENTFLRNFSVTYEMYGESKTEPLKSGGEKIPLTLENRQEYVELYIDWVLNKSIEKQFKAFYTGFHLCASGPALELFRPEELELLVCGSPTFDFEAFEAATRYEDGFTKNCEVVKWFWEIVHALNDEDKKKLLSFCTGSDRVPIRGLGSMRFTISRNGPDSDLLPTSHTCFNHLLLPEYSSKEKLKRLLQLALQNSQGFGMI
jgi:hypothetical protein